MMLNPENQLLQSFQTPNKSPLGNLGESKKKTPKKPLRSTDFTLIKNSEWALGSASLSTKSHSSCCACLNLEDPTQGPGTLSSLLDAMGDPQGPISMPGP